MPRGKSKKTALVEEPHFNAQIDQDDLEAMVTGDLTGERHISIAERLDTTVGSVRRKLREIELPSWYPEPSEVNQTIKELYEVVVLKALHRLAHKGVEMMDLKSLPVALGIATDKLQLLNGQATSLSLQVHTTVKHEELRGELMASKSKVVDVQPVDQAKQEPTST